MTASVEPDLGPVPDTTVDTGTTGMIDVTIDVTDAHRAADREKRAPGRPRSARVDEAIVEAVLTMLGEGVGVEALSIEAVAARAGVGKATIYRRWASKEALIVDAVAALKGPIPTLAGNSIREDLVTLLRSISQVQDDRSGRVLSCLVPQAQRSESLYKLYMEIVEPRREVGRQVLRRGIANGELRADLDVELALAMLTAPVVVQNMMRWNPRLDREGLPEAVVDTLLRGLTVRDDAVAPA